VLLARSGFSLAALADTLGVSGPRASLYLAGRTRLPDHFAATVAELTGDATAAEIVAEARAARERNQEEARTVAGGASL